MCAYDGVQKDSNEKEMTKHTAEGGSDNETKEQEMTKTEREKATKAMSIK